MVFKRLSFFEWKEKKRVEFHLCVLTLDLPLLKEKPIIIAYYCSNEDKIHHKA